MAVPNDPVLVQQHCGHDPVENPAHYTFSDVEPIDVIEAWGLNFHMGCILKYVCRAGRKGDKVEDLKKARWYLDREIQRLTE